MAWRFGRPNDKCAVAHGAASTAERTIYSRIGEPVLLSNETDDTHSAGTPSTQPIMGWQASIPSADDNTGL
ncbi:unnamed protein product, partial [Mesorhabditis spiculigera]